MAKTKNTKVKFGETDILKSQLARALADYDNLAKRIEKEKESFSDVANMALVKRLIQPIDMLYEAQKHLNDTGLAIAINEFEMVFADFGIEKIDPKPGEKFNENLHEVTEVIQGENDSTISSVILVGWKYKEGLVVRHAKVIVIKKG